MPPKYTEAERIAAFWAKVDKSQGEDACWPWTGNCCWHGYGVAVVGRPKTTKAHREAYRLTQGEIPQGKLVMHSCDNRPCCNPAHLSLGTIADNTADKVAKGRQTRGSRVNTAKLTEAYVLVLRGLSNDGVPIRVLAKKSGVSEKTARLAVRGLTWKHAEEDLTPC